MSKKYLGIFYKEWYMWMHYVALVIILFFAFFSLNWLGIVNMSASLSWWKWIFLFVWYFLFISVGDQLIHAFLGLFGVKD